MIDTIRFRTEYLDEDIIDIINTKMCVRQGIDFNTGENMYIIISNTLAENTYNRAITIKVERKEWQKQYSSRYEKMVACKVDSKPYIIIECSAHKILMGHNIYGGSDNIYASVALIIKRISELYDIPDSVFGNINNFEVLRMDFAKNFRIPSVSKYIEFLNNCYYPRRNVVRRQNQSIYIVGTTTTIKFYDKFKEFKVHDYKKIKNDKLLEMSKNILRVEVEFKRRKLKDEFESLKLKDVNMGKIIKLYDSELNKIFKTKVIDGKKLVGVDVYDLLCQNYSSQLATTLFASYNILLIGGIDKLFEKVPRSTAYRHIQSLKELGIYWGNEVKLIYSDERKEFVNFIPNTKSSYAIN